MQFEARLREKYEDHAAAIRKEIKGLQSDETVQWARCKDRYRLVLQDLKLACKQSQHRKEVEDFQARKLREVEKLLKPEKAQLDQQRLELAAQQDRQRALEADLKGQSRVCQEERAALRESEKKFKLKGDKLAALISDFERRTRVVERRIASEKVELGVKQAQLESRMTELTSKQQQLELSRIKVRKWQRRLIAEQEEREGAIS